MADVAAGQIMTADLFNRKVRKSIAHARRTTTSSASTGSAVGVIRMDDIPIRAGIQYRISWKARTDSNVHEDICYGEIRYTTDGSTPTTSSSQLQGSVAETGQTDGGVGFTLYSTTYYAPLVNETLSILLTVVRSAGTGNNTFYADGSINVTDLYIDDMGDEPGLTGTNV